MGKVPTKQKVCDKHGLTEYVLESSGYFRCRKCRTGHQCKRAKNIKQKALEYAGGKCIICGYAKCARALSFHHIDPSKKEFEISGEHSRSWEKIKKEIDKCALLCANCHHELHAGMTELPTGEVHGERRVL